DLFWNQWGVVVELAPDVMAENEAGGKSSEFHYYQNAGPRQRKTDTTWMDDSCPSLTYHNLGTGGDLITTISTAVNANDWQTDIRGIPATGASKITIPNMGGSTYDESKFYTTTGNG